MTPRRTVSRRQPKQAASAARQAPVLTMPPAVDSWGRPRNPLPRKVANPGERFIA